MQDLIGYDEIIESSMRSVIYETLKKIEKTGLPGSHYFVITFLTRHPDSKISKSLKEKYQDEMTIAIQYQYKQLNVENDKFTISLSFNGQYETLVIPYKAITSFADPSMNFALKFTMSYDDLSNIEEKTTRTASSKKTKEAESKDSDVDLTAKVISLDAFRQNKDEE